MHALLMYLLFAQTQGGVITGWIAPFGGTILPDFPFTSMAVTFSPSSVPNIALVQKDGTLPESYTVKSAIAGGADIAKGMLKIDGRPVPEIIVTLEYRPKSTP